MTRGVRRQTLCLHRFDAAACASQPTLARSPPPPVGDAR